MTQTQAQAGRLKHLPAGYTAITPFLCVDGGSAAIDFYISVLGATLVRRFDLPDGRVAEAELDLGDGRLLLGDPNAEHGLVAPEATGPVTHSYVHYCPDVDGTYAEALAAGATGLAEPQTFVTGDRYALVRDPFGHRWALMTRVEHVPAEEAERRVNAWLASTG